MFGKVWHVWKNWETANLCTLCICNSLVTSLSIKQQWHKGLGPWQWRSVGKHKSKRWCDKRTLNAQTIFLSKKACFASHELGRFSSSKECVFYGFHPNKLPGQSGEGVVSPWLAVWEEMPIWNLLQKGNKLVKESYDHFGRYSVD